MEPCGCLIAQTQFKNASKTKELNCARWRERRHQALSASSWFAKHAEPRQRRSLMNGRILSSDGRHIADIWENAIYNLAGQRLYYIRGQKIYKPTGELIGHLNSASGDTRLDKATERLFLES